MPIGTLQRRFTLLIGQLICWAYENGYELTGGEWARTKEQQALYVKQGKSKTMSSRHLQRLAMDFNLFQDGKYLQRTEEYRPLGDYWKSLDPRCIWGGDWKSFPDGNHFEMWE